MYSATVRGDDLDLRRVAPKVLDSPSDPGKTRLP
jgi:hypothetical protein